MTGIEVAQHAPAVWTVSRPRERLGDDAASVVGVHAALRHLVLACRAERRPLPVAPIVVADGEVLELHLAAPLGPAPAPWQTRGHVWSVEIARLGSVPVALDAYPALVPLGRVLPEPGEGEAGESACPSGLSSPGSRGWLLADLGAAPGLVEIDGEPGVVGALQRSIALSLLEHPWSGGVRVTLVDLPSPDHPRVRPAAALDVALGTPPEPLGGVSGRWGRPPRGEHEVVLVGRALAESEVRLVRRASRWRGAATVVAPGAGRGVWQWRADAEGLTW